MIVVAILIRFLDRRSSTPSVYIAEYSLLSDYPELRICSLPFLLGHEESILPEPLLEVAVKFLPWQEFVKLMCNSSLRELVTGVKLPWQ
jgi:hypothetical protein